MTKKVAGTRLLAAGVGALVLLAGTGCAARDRMAYSIDGAVTTIAQVQTMADSCQKAWKGTLYSESTQWIVNAMIRSDLAYLVAKAQAVAYDDATLTQQLQAGQLGEQAQAMMADPGCAGLAVGLGVDALASYELGSGQYAAAVGQHSLVLNPRFGTWDGNRGLVGGTGSMSSPDTGR